MKYKIRTITSIPNDVLPEDDIRLRHRYEGEGLSVVTGRDSDNVQSDYTHRFLTEEDVFNQYYSNMIHPNNIIPSGGRGSAAVWYPVSYNTGARDPETLSNYIVPLNGTAYLPLDDWDFFCHSFNRYTPEERVEAYEIFAKAGRGANPAVPVYRGSMPLPENPGINDTHSDARYGRGFYIPRLSTGVVLLNPIDIEGEQFGQSTMTTIPGVSIGRACFAIWIKCTAGKVAVQGQARDNIITGDKDSVVWNKIAPGDGWVHIAGTARSISGVISNILAMRAMENSEFTYAIPFIGRGDYLVRTWKHPCPLPNENKLAPLP